MPRCINCNQPLLDFAAARLPEYRVDLPPPRAWRNSAATTAARPGPPTSPAPATPW